jgi:Protein of unknown function (DUF4031)
VTVYVDNANIPFRGMIMSHLWSDALPELLAMVDVIGVQRKWLQKPPKASWVHFDISFGKKKLATARGAVLTDKYGPLEYEAHRKGDHAKLDLIAKLRAQNASSPIVDRTEPRQGALVL